MHWDERGGRGADRGVKSGEEGGWRGLAKRFRAVPVDYEYAVGTGCKMRPLGLADLSSRGCFGLDPYGTVTRWQGGWEHVRTPPPPALRVEHSTARAPDKPPENWWRVVTCCTGYTASHGTRWGRTPSHERSRMLLDASLHLGIKIKGPKTVPTPTVSQSKHLLHRGRGLRCGCAGPRCSTEGGEGGFSSGDNFGGENFDTPPTLVRGHQTQETSTPQPLVPCGQAVV